MKAKMSQMKQSPKQEEPAVEQKPAEKSSQPAEEPQQSSSDDSRPIGKSDKSAPSWADFMKETQEEEAKNPTPKEEPPKPAAAKKAPAKPTAAPAKTVDPEEEEKKRLKKEEQEKQRAEMKAKLAQIKQSGPTKQEDKPAEQPTEVKTPTKLSSSSNSNPSPSRLDLSALTSSTFELKDLDSLINLELRTANDVPQYSRKDILKTRYLALEQTRDEQKDIVAKRDQIRKTVEQESKENAQLRSTIMQFTDIASTLGPLIKETKKLSVNNAEKIRQFNDSTSNYEQLKTMLDSSIRMEATLGERLSQLDREHKLAQQRYNALRSQAEKKIKDINEELLQLKSSTDASLFLNAARGYRAEHKVTEMTERIAIQEKSNAHLVTLCEEMLQQLEKMQPK